MLRQRNRLPDSRTQKTFNCWSSRHAFGSRLFPDRHAATVAFQLNADEFNLYKAVTAYINEFIPQQTGQRRNSAALARTVLQRRLASSACAIHESLKRRRGVQSG